MPADPDAKNTLSLATTAPVENKTLTVRYTQDGVPCGSGGRDDVVGVYLHNY